MRKSRYDIVEYSDGWYDAKCLSCRRVLVHCNSKWKAEQAITLHDERHHPEVAEGYEAKCYRCGKPIHHSFNRQWVHPNGELFDTSCYSDHDEDIRTKGACEFCLSTERDLHQASPRSIRTVRKEV